MNFRLRHALPHLPLVLLCLLIGIVTMQEFSYHVTPGLDQTYRWALNYFLAKDRAILAYINYSYGPLTLLKWPVPIGDHILISSVFNIALNAFFVYSFTSFYRAYHKTEQYIQPVLIALVYLLAVNFDYILVGAIALNLVYAFYEKKRFPLWAALVISVAGVYIKTAIMVLILTIWFVFILYLLFKKRFKELAVIAIGGLAIYFIVGLLLFYSISATWSYAVYNLSLTFGYSDVLALYPDNNILYLGISLGCILAILLIYVRQPAGFVVALLSLCFFANWKYAMSYEGYWHAISFFYLLLLALVLAVVVQQKRTALMLGLFLLSIGTYAHNLTNVLHYHNSLIWIPDVTIFKEWVLNHDESKKRVWQESKDASAVNILPGDVLHEIGERTVDIIPYDLSYAMINDLHYKPRPTLQAGLFAADRDKKDAEFIEKGKGADYFIWHSFGGKTTIDGIDDNYLPNTNPYLFETLWQYYVPTNFHNERYTIWKKRASPQVQTKTESDIHNVKWSEWVDAPTPDSNERIRVKIDVPFTTKYKLRSAVYKGLPVFIEMETESGRIVRYTFAPSRAAVGLLASPLYTDHDMKYEVVKRIRFSNQRPGEGYYNDKLSIQWIRIAYEE